MHEHTAIEAATSPGSSAWTGDSEALGLDRPALRIKATQLTQLLARDDQKAVACHDHVRGLRFLPGGRAHRSAPQVLAAGVGTSFEKSNLLVALLRCVGIAARLRIYTVRAALLEREGADAGLAFHPVVEAFLGGSWVSTDTFHLDVQHALASRRRLLQEHRRAGYGAHLDGAATWDGRHDAFALFTPLDPASLPLRDWGAFDDSTALAREVCRLEGYLAGQAGGLAAWWSRRQWARAGATMGA
jgi:hypothetical protein